MLPNDCAFDRLSSMIPLMSDRKYGQALGTTVKALRGVRTQKEVADAAGIPISTLSKIEQSRQIPRDETFVKIAQGLGLTEAELEQEIVETTLSVLEEEHRKASGSRRSPPSTSKKKKRRAQSVDLSGVPRSAALRLKSTLATIDAFRNHLDNLDHDIQSLIREFQILRGGSRR